MTHTSMCQFHTGWGTKFDSGRLLWIVMIFQKNLLSFSSLSLVYDPYEHVPISYRVGDVFGGVRLLWIVMIFQKNLLSFSSMSLVYDPYEHVPISYGVKDVFWQCYVTMNNDDISKESTVVFIIELGI